MGVGERLEWDRFSMLCNLVYLPKSLDFGVGSTWVQPMVRGLSKFLTFNPADLELEEIVEKTPLEIAAKICLSGVDSRGPEKLQSSGLSQSVADIRTSPGPT